ncbi:hypothetical protein B0H17DRAFT_1031352 [Mycena rosella]|uniref:Secreted protein n=1 Tax=Mycena rosella TaxID=1033263 RepID=A0AAD7H0D2_MYCRO|nr:hypothetical protein B0H17DRAFT_1031352 [Mycena rosella]
MPLMTWLISMWLMTGLVAPFPGHLPDPALLSLSVLTCTERRVTGCGTLGEQRVPRRGWNGRRVLELVHTVL